MVKKKKTLALLNDEDLESLTKKPDFSDYFKEELKDNGWEWDIENSQYYKNGHIIDKNTIMDKSWFILHGMEYVYSYYVVEFSGMFKKADISEEGDLGWVNNIHPDYFSLTADGSIMSNYTLGKDDDLLTVEEAAKELGVSGKTIREWDNNGKLETTRTVGGHRRISREEIEKIKGNKYSLECYRSKKNKILRLMKGIREEVDRMIVLIEENSIQPLNNYLKLIDTDKIDCAIYELVNIRDEIEEKSST